MKCEYCDIIGRQSKGQILYEDDELIVAIRDNVVTPGQITVFTREHFTILELVPDLLLAKCAVVANKVSIAIFESLGSQGTNILIRNGIAAGQSVPHCGIDVIPRIEDDGLSLNWQGKPLSEDDLEMTVRALDEDLKKQAPTKRNDPPHEDSVPPPAQPGPEEVPRKEIKKKPGSENYLLRTIRRIP